MDLKNLADLGDVRNRASVNANDEWNEYLEKNKNAFAKNGGPSAAEREKFFQNSESQSFHKALNQGKVNPNFVGPNKDAFTFSKHESAYIQKQDSRQVYENIARGKIADTLRSEGKWSKDQGLNTNAGFGLLGSLYKSDAIANKASLRHDSGKVFKESVMNNMGFLTKNQKLQYNTSSALGKFSQGGLTAGTSLYFMGQGMLDGESPDDILANQIGTGVGYASGIIGMRAVGATGIGHSATSVGGKLLKRTLPRLGGFAAGMVAGSMAVEGIHSGLKDLTSSESVIGHKAHEAYQRTTLFNTNHTKQTLTARQKALQQISSSVLNDRGFTLGNEASILRNMAM